MIYQWEACESSMNTTDYHEEWKLKFVEISINQLDLYLYHRYNSIKHLSKKENKLNCDQLKW